MSKCADVSLKLKNKIQKVCDLSNNHTTKFKQIASNVDVLSSVEVKAVYKKGNNIVTQGHSFWKDPEISVEKKNTIPFNESDIGKQVAAINADYNDICNSIKTAAFNQLTDDLQSIRNDLNTVRDHLKDLNVGKNKIQNNIADTIENINKSLAYIEKSVK